MPTKKAIILYLQVSLVSVPPCGGCLLWNFSSWTIFWWQFSAVVHLCRTRLYFADTSPIALLKFWTWSTRFFLLLLLSCLSLYCSPNFWLYPPSHSLFPSLPPPDWNLRMCPVWRQASFLLLCKNYCSLIHRETPANSDRQIKAATTTAATISAKNSNWRLQKQQPAK